MKNKKFEHKSGENRQNKMMKNDIGDVNTRKKSKRKINGECEAPIDKKIVKLEKENEKSCSNSEENDPENVKTEETLETPMDNDDEMEGTNDNKKSSANDSGNRITGKYIRKVLNGAGGIGILRKFVSICNNENEKQKYDLAAEYLEAKGSVLEILRLLDEADKKNSANAAIIFSAMQIVIMKIISQYPQYLTNAEEACRHFINSHLSSVHSMFSSQSIPQHRKICLRLLSAIVSLGGSLPRELLGHLSFHSQTLELLCQHTKPTDSNNVRTCFIHFIISFLVDGSIGVIRALLDKRGMLASIFPGLIYDTPTTVHLVLNTVKTYVLENNLVSKTAKLHLFSTPVVQNLVSLYNWKGPSQWPGMNPKKAKPITQSIDPEDKQIATEAVHEFLLLLLTSTRHGIIFNDKTLGTSGRKHNQLANSILQSLDKPWEHEKPRELVTKILSSTPDLIKSQLIYMEASMTPRLSQKWIQLMQFIRSIIAGINYELILMPNLGELTFSQLISASLTFSVPQIVLKNAITPAISDSNIIVRHEAIVTLTNMLGQVKKILELMKNHHSHDAIEFVQFKTTICDYIIKNSPCLTDLLRSWQQTFIENNEEEKSEGNLQDMIDAPSKLNHFSSMIDLLEIYCHICPEYLKCFKVNNDEHLEPNILLKSLNTIEQENSNEEFNKLKIKVIEFILSINPDVFINDKEHFSDSLLFLISLLNNDQLEIDLNAIKAIKRILISSKTFEGTEDQIEIWINCFKLLNDNDKLIEVGKWFVKLLLRTIKKTDEYLNRIIKAQKEMIDNELHECVESKIIMQSSQSIPPLFCAAVDNLKKNANEDVANYLSSVTILTLHCQINPGTMIKLTENIETLPNKYLKSWSTKNGNNIKKPFNNDDLLRKYSKMLLTNEAIVWKSVFEGDKKREINYNNELIVINHSLNDYEVLTLLKMTLFYLTQSLRQMEMTNEQFERYKMSIIILLNITVNSENKLNEQCLKLIYTNPILLQYFAPLPKEMDKNPLEIIITNGLIYEISRIIIEKLNSNHSLTNKIFVAFKQKFLSQMKLLIDKSTNGWRINETINLNKFIEIFHLESCDIFYLLNGIMELPNKIILSIDKNNLSAWGEIVPNLIELQLKNGQTTSGGNPAMVKKMLNHLSQLSIKSKANIDSWITALNNYLIKYPQNIALIDAKLFKVLLQRDLTTSTIDLIGLFINRNDKFIPQFIEHVTKTNSTLLKRSELIFPTLSSNLNYKWSDEFLKAIFQQYINDIANYFACQTTESNNWIDNNINSTLYLINSTFTSDICEKIIEKILSSGDKLGGININYIKLLRCLIKKSAKLQEQNNSTESTINFIQILIRIGVFALKKNSANDMERLDLICSYLCEAIDDLKSINSNIILDEVNKNHSWPQFSRFSLKIGLKVSKDTETKMPAILGTLAKLCSLVYKDNSDNEYVKTIFEMTESHSEFMNIMRGNDPTKKCQLLELILVLVRKNYSLMTQNHIPLYLSAYNATLNKCDQIILMILQHYEREKIKFNDYKPYFWGEAAANYYSIKGEADTALWRQPSTTQVFDLFNTEMVTKTIENFPIKRSLSSNDLAENTPHDNNIYDPAFYLPLFTYLMADNNVVICNRVTQNGALSLAFAACGSACEDVRIAAFTVLSRFYFHLEGTSYKERLLWMRILDGLRNGLSTPIRETRISCLVSTFLAKASLVSTQPLHPLYPRVQSFFMAKPALDLNTIPEFLTFFHSSEINYKTNRQWILEVVRDGMKSEHDVDLALKCVIFRMLFDFYHCILADAQTKNLILEIVNASVKIPKARQLLMRSYSLVVWLNNVVKRIEQHDRVDIKLIMNIINNLMDTLTQANDREHNQYMLLTVVKNLAAKLTKNLDINTLNDYLKSLNDLSDEKLFKQIIVKSDIESLITLSSKVTDINVDECLDMLNNGCQFINRDESINNDNDNTKNNLIESNLRQLLINWHSHDSQMIET